MERGRGVICRGREEANVFGSFRGGEEASASRALSTAKKRRKAVCWERCSRCCVRRGWGEAEPDSPSLSRAGKRRSQRLWLCRGRRRGGRRCAGNGAAVAVSVEGGERRSRIHHLCRGRGRGEASVSGSVEGEEKTGGGVLGTVRCPSRAGRGESMHFKVHSVKHQVALWFLSNERTNTDTDTPGPGSVVAD
jgi:hypothetical protein